MKFLFLLCVSASLRLNAETRTNVVWRGDFVEAPENNAALSPTNVVVFRVWQTGDLKFRSVTNGNNLTVIFSEPVRAGARFLTLSTEWKTNITEVVPLYSSEIVNASTVPTQWWPQKPKAAVNAPKTGKLVVPPKAVKTKPLPIPGR